ncbi:hypothetical protein EW146_g5926, partial [Bondarzewia mesenterica]
TTDMPKHYCDYCDVYLTHDSASVRKAHNSGRNHLANVRDYYASLGHDKAQSIIDQITSAYESSGGPPPGGFGFGPQHLAPAGPPFGGPPFGGPGGFTSPPAGFPQPPFPPGPGGFPPPGMMGPPGGPPFPPAGGMPPGMGPPNGFPGAPPFPPQNMPPFPAQNAPPFSPPNAAAPGSAPPFPPNFAPGPNQPPPNFSGPPGQQQSGQGPPPQSGGPPGGIGPAGMHPDRMKLLNGGCSESFTRSFSLVSHVEETHRGLLNREVPAAGAEVLKRLSRPHFHQPRTLPSLPRSCRIDKISRPTVQYTQAQMHTSVPQSSVVRKWSRLGVQDTDDQDSMEIQFDDLPGADTRSKKRRRLNDPPPPLDYITVLPRKTPTPSRPQLSCPLIVSEQQIPAPDPPLTFLYSTFSLRFDELEKQGLTLGDGIWRDASQSNGAGRHG